MTHGRAAAFSPGKFPGGTKRNNGFHTPVQGVLVLKIALDGKMVWTYTPLVVGVSFGFTLGSVLAQTFLFSVLSREVVIMPQGFLVATPREYCES